MKSAPETSAIHGVYHFTGIAAVTYYRLTLHPGGAFVMDYWRDMGGKWQRWATGNFSTADGYVNLEFGLNVFAAERYSILKIIPPQPGRQLILLPYQTGTNEKPVTEKTNCFIKEAFPTWLICTELESGNNHFGNSLTLHSTYYCLGKGGGDNTLKICNDHGRQGTYPAALFREPVL
ncbi:hypothetical protein ACTHGU_02275 [Chitinophagaceae bacterium MMS25-I14]